MTWGISRICTTSDEIICCDGDVDLGAKLCVVTEEATQVGSISLRVLAQTPDRVENKIVKRDTPIRIDIVCGRHSHSFPFLLVCDKDRKREKKRNRQQRKKANPHHVDN